MTIPPQIHARFLLQARRAPWAIALATREGTISYGRLDELSRSLAARMEAGQPPEARLVGILAERGAALVVAMLACLRAGRPFVVLDLSYPQERLKTLIDICRPGLLLGAAETIPERLRDLEPPLLHVDLNAAAIDDDSFPDAATSPDAPAYLLFTSGSTGAPKCVACSHHPLVNFIDWQARTFGLTADDRFTLLSGLSHDPVLRDVFTPLSLGASIHIPPQATLTTPGELYPWFQDARPTVAHMTPPLGRLLTAVRGSPAPLPDLRYVFWGGDVLRKDLVDNLSAVAPRCESVNFYGSTETPQAAAFFRVPADFPQARIPIGRGIDGFHLDIRAEGSAADYGEILVRSRLLTLGYVQNGRLPPARSPTEEQTYATGDIGRRRSDGQLEIQGRRDDQVKVRGYRVEMAEVTAAALRRHDVTQALTLDIGSADEARLCCFVEPAKGCAPAAEEIRSGLAAVLPVYMVPDRIEFVQAMPLLPNGKIDRQALLAQARSAAPSPVDEPARPATAVEEALLKRWRGLFPHDRISVASSFASLGGDSLSYVNAYLYAEEVLGSVPEAWITMSVAELAATAPGQAEAPPIFSAVESGMLLRAVAICAVVASHFDLVATGSAATSALIWVSGYLFGRLQLKEVDLRGSLASIGRLLRGILIPLMLLEVPQFLVKLATHHNPRLSSILLYVDLLDYTGLPLQGPNAYGGVEYLMWYIHCVIHIVLIYVLLICVFRFGLKLRRPAAAAALLAVPLGLAARFLLPMVFLPDFWSHRIDALSFFNHSPTVYLATFSLAALAGLHGGRWAVGVVGGMAAYAVASAPIYGALDSLAVVGIAALIVLAPKIPFPRRLSTPVYLVAGASFFIYLLHFKFLVVFDHLHAPRVLAWLGAVVGGVVAWKVWNWAVRKAPGFFAALRAGAPILGERSSASASPAALALAVAEQR